MQIRMLTSKRVAAMQALKAGISSHIGIPVEDGFALKIGRIYDLPDAFALALIREGSGELVSGPSVTPVIGPRHTKPAGPSRKKG